MVFQIFVSDFFSVMLRFEIGCGQARISHPTQPHDKIKICGFTKQSISRRAAEMYTSGASLASIAGELGVAKATIRQTLIASGVSLRTHSNSQLNNSPITKKKSIKNAPYGYCLVGGQLFEDPREMAVIQRMLAWWRTGMSFGAITRQLNSQNIKPRKAAQWSQPTVGFIIQRQTDQPKEV
jgi:hypothetical protein